MYRELFNRCDIAFYDKNMPTDPGFTLTLNQRMTYPEARKNIYYFKVKLNVAAMGDVLERVEWEQKERGKKKPSDSARDRTGDLECVRLT